MKPKRMTEARLARVIERTGLYRGKQAEAAAQKVLDQVRVLLLTARR